ncbi:DUF3368 domain-containing protein [Algoriphagus mannitolivorans]|uniref:DUF3368 domain-containing protein n=1 Tax=Algoriphagus mannitolivorans TaxID=226504 RepID=UPI0004199E08|nr:DUF3368 domain-containing protein [Algoriphagus mannitolivorans]
MEKIILSDTSCLILLEKIGELELLHSLFGTLTITPEISEEYKKPLPSWIQIESPKNKTYQLILEASLDKGESSAIALCLERKNPLLIIDDLKGRKLAGSLEINIIGSLGILILAKRKKIIFSIKPVLEKIKRTDFRISKELEKTVLYLCHEE